MGEQEFATESSATAHNNNFDQILNLFDLYWFHHSILRFTPPPPTAPPVHQVPPESSLIERNTDDQSQLTPSPRPIQHRRTRSDETMSTTSSAPAPVALKPPRLRTIPSGKEALTDLIQSSEVHVADVMEAAERRRLSKSRMKRRSMSELELEELKGLLDLGFEFPDTEVEKDPRIADIVPGLRKRRISEGGEVQVARRPYLSEAWRFRDDNERSRVLKDWTVLANGDERDVKEQLRRWAHVVASTVR